MKTSFTTVLFSICLTSVMAHTPPDGYGNGVWNGGHDGPAPVHTSSTPPPPMGTGPSSHNSRPISPDMASPTDAARMRLRRVRRNEGGGWNGPNGWNVPPPDSTQAGHAGPTGGPGPRVLPRGYGTGAGQPPPPSTRTPPGAPYPTDVPRVIPPGQRGDTLVSVTVTRTSSSRAPLGTGTTETPCTSHNECACVQTVPMMTPQCVANASGRTVCMCSLAA